MVGYNNTLLTCNKWYIAIVQACHIKLMIFLPTTAWYISTFLTCNIQSGAICINNNLIWLNDGIISLQIMWNGTFNAPVESSKIVVTCPRAYVIQIRTHLQYSSISTYIHTIPHRHINPVSYHIGYSGGLSEFSRFIWIQIVNMGLCNLNIL